MDLLPFPQRPACQIPPLAVTAWYYRLLHEVVFGIERRVDTLRFRPRVPASWAGFKVHYRNHQSPVRLGVDVV